MIPWIVASHLFSTFAGGGLLKLFLRNLIGDAKAVLAFLRAHSIWLTVSIALGLGWGVDHVISHRHTAKVEKQLSAANNALSTARANVTTLKVALAKQNAAVAALGSKSTQQQKAGAQASQVAAGRANEAQATSDRLKQSSRSTGLKSAPCEPSDTLKGQWK